MNWKGLVNAVRAAAVKNSPAIFTGLGIVGFGTTVIMTAKAAPKAKKIHDAAVWDRKAITDDISYAGDDQDAIVPLKDEMKQSYIQEAKDLAPVYLPVGLVGVASVGCILMANKIHADRQAAVMAAYSISTETLARYQDKVVAKLGEEVHKDILNETTKEMARDHTPEDLNPDTIVNPEGTVRCYDTVTGRYFFSSKERILAAESEVNKRLINEIRVPLQEFYYELGLEEKFSLAENAGWDISNPYYNAGNMDIYFTPMLDDDRNPCLALNYHITVFERQL